MGLRHLLVEVAERLRLGARRLGDEALETPAEIRRVGKVRPGPGVTAASPSVSTMETSMPSMDVPLMTPIALTGTGCGIGSSRIPVTAQTIAQAAKRSRVV
jgi:hypothetical protein